MDYGHLPLSDAQALAACRTQAGWEVCVEDGVLWVRAEQPAEELWQRLPFDGRYTSADQGRLIRTGETVPARLVPGSPWQALIHWMPVPRPATLPGGVSPPPVEIRPVRVVGEERPADLLILPRHVWEPWAITAPEIRLRPLRFAQASDGRVCVWGTPLPPLPGEPWALHQAIALPAGWGFPGTCTPAWLAAMLEVPADGFALWHEDGGSEVLPSTAFVPATRANVRATALGLEAVT